MRFVLSVALKYLVPKWRQLSVSIISIVSVLVISLVVWLAIVFLSVSEGIQNKWVGQLLALNAPVRLTPTTDYFESYYYQIDALSSNSNYTSKSIGDKLASVYTDPFDPLFDATLPQEFPSPQYTNSGQVLDIVKETYQIIKSIPEASPSEFETALGNLRINLVKSTPGQGLEETSLSQVSYFTCTNAQNKVFSQLILPPTSADLNHLLASIPSQSLFSFFDYLTIKVVANQLDIPLLPSLYPETGTIKGCGVLNNGEVQRVIVPATMADFALLKRQLESKGQSVAEVVLHFSEGMLEENYPQLLLANDMLFEAHVIKESLNRASSYKDVELHVCTEVQGVSLEGIAPLRYFHLLKTDIVEDSPFWSYRSHVPMNNPLGEGILVSKNYMNNGVRLGDTGYISYFAPTATSQQERRIPVYVSGFYDPGLVAMGNRFVFVDPKVISSLRNSLAVVDQNLGNGLNVWLTQASEAQHVANLIKAKLKEQDLDRYWLVESFHDYEFIRPILQQLQSDQTLFTLVTVIILVVACSNIISMLILLVNDKRKEIGILLAMGATRTNIACIFGLCGFITGFTSSLLGTVIAIITLKQIKSLVHLLNMLQGHDMFQAAFYGSSLPNDISWSAIAAVLISTLLLSLLAGLIPAIKAARVKPTEILRAE